MFIVITVATRSTKTKTKRADVKSGSEEYRYVANFLFDIDAVSAFSTILLPDSVAGFLDCGIHYRRRLSVPTDGTACRRWPAHGRIRLGISRRSRRQWYPMPVAFRNGFPARLAFSPRHLSQIRLFLHHGVPCAVSPLRTWCCEYLLHRSPGLDEALEHRPAITNAISRSSGMCIFPMVMFALQYTIRGVLRCISKSASPVFSGHCSCTTYTCL